MTYEVKPEFFGRLDDVWAAFNLDDPLVAESLQMGLDLTILLHNNYDFLLAFSWSCRVNRTARIPRYVFLDATPGGTSEV
jgi:hypothetical protein